MSADTLTNSADYRYHLATGSWPCDCDGECRCREQLEHDRIIEDERDEWYASLEEAERADQGEEEEPC